MRISTRMAAGVLSGLLISATYGPVFAQSHATQDSRGATTDLTIPCDPLSWDAANKLPWFIKASDIKCMSPTQDDLQASIQARSLLVRAAAQLPSARAMSDSTAETEYKDGIAAYASGRYIEAIAHFSSGGTVSPAIAVRRDRR
jgi:hypothetical protein